MSLLDIVLLIILLGFTFNGLRRGMFRLLGRVFGLFISIYVSSNFHAAIYYWAKEVFAWSANEFFGKLITFIVVFIVTTYLIQALFRLLEKIFKILAIVPGSKYINNAIGAILGFFEGTLFLGLIIFIATNYAILGNLINVSERLAHSVVVPFLLKIVDLILPLLPPILSLLKGGA